ncbi:MAG: hypothetical protein AMXMBFR33_69660 [Candidatus Xenobia bacterium]
MKHLVYAFPDRQPVGRPEGSVALQAELLASVQAAAKAGRMGEPVLRAFPLLMADLDVTLLPIDRQTFPTETTGCLQGPGLEIVPHLEEYRIAWLSEVGQLIILEGHDRPNRRLGCFNPERKAFAVSQLHQSVLAR